MDIGTVEERAGPREFSPKNDLPGEYRRAATRMIQFHANSEIMGGYLERPFIRQSPSLDRKLAFSAKVQDEIGHGQLLYRAAELLGVKTREDILRELATGSRRERGGHRGSGRATGVESALDGGVRHRRRVRGAAGVRGERLMGWRDPSTETTDDGEPAVCPYCESENTVREHPKGPSSCRSIHLRRDCLEPFERCDRVWPTVTQIAV
jgi:hypothetical protein